MTVRELLRALLEDDIDPDFEVEVWGLSEEQHVIQNVTLELGGVVVITADMP